MKVLHFALAISLLLIIFGTAVAQGTVESSAAQTSQMEMKPGDCEYNVSILTAAHNAAGADGLVIVIARLGNGERRKEFNRRRLHNVRTFLTEFGNRAAQTIITATGERAGGYGRIELYVGGKLFHVLMIRPNDDLAVGSCSFDGNNPCAYKREKKLYPCLNRNLR